LQLHNSTAKRDLFGEDARWHRQHAQRFVNASSGEGGLLLSSESFANALQELVLAIVPDGVYLSVLFRVALVPRFRTQQIAMQAFAIFKERAPCVRPQLLVR